MGHKEETATYILEMTRELARLAERADLQVLAYLLRMAEAEADGQTCEGMRASPN